VGGPVLVAAIGQAWLRWGDQPLLPSDGRDLDEAGLSARSTADQLGHAKPSLTADIYMGRKKRATGAEVLEGVLQP
jgi:hypothetical protein